MSNGAEKFYSDIAPDQMGINARQQICICEKQQPGGKNKEKAAGEGTREAIWHGAR